MDSKTHHYYETQGERLVQRYASADLSEFHSLLKQWLPPSGRVLEIGCGTGRDALYMSSLGCSVTALDGSEIMAALTRKAFSEAGMDPARVFCASFPLPLEHELLSERFHAVVAVAMLMHVPESELFEFCRQIGTLLEDQGLFICSFSSGEREEGDERLFVSRTPEEVELLLEKFGFRRMYRKETSDGLGRKIPWHNLVFSRDRFRGN